MSLRPRFPVTDATLPPVKVCGLTRLEDAIHCAAAGVAAIGINFWPKSKRFHPISAAGLWLEQVPTSLTRVAVLVNASAEEVWSLLRSGMIDVAQFHGDESDAFIQPYLDAGYACIRALSVRTEADLEKIAQSPLDTLLLDAYQPGLYGGSGLTCDWALAAQAVQSFPEKQIILSGGLTPENAAQAWQQVRPAALDLASGVESAPGIKSAAAITALMEALRNPG
jgi:phosphoribosylanthranilate isomerase